MELILYRIDDAKNVINKTLENGLTIDIQLKGVSDFSNMTLVLMRDNETEFNTFNYCHIPHLNRYYFIEQITAVNNRLVNYVCVCDVLESYKSDILASVARLRRNIKAGDYYDGAFDDSVKHTSTKYDGDNGFGGEHTNIFTSLGDIDDAELNNIGV